MRVCSILADDMGLGKTLQGVALLWTLLQNGAPALGGTPVVKRAIIVCPTSLVSNWDSECRKWLMVSSRTCLDYSGLCQCRGLCGLSAAAWHVCRCGCIPSTAGQCWPDSLGDYDLQ